MATAVRDQLQVQIPSNARLFEATPAPLKTLQTIALSPLVKGRFDHFAVDLKHNRLFATPEDYHAVIVLDLVTAQPIAEMIIEKMSPEFEGETPIQVTDFWDGANFKFKVRKDAGFIKYDKSEFEAPSKLFEGDETRLKALYESFIPLAQFVDPSKIKDYDALKARYDKIVNGVEEPASDGEKAAAPKVTPAPAPASAPAPSSLKETPSREAVSTPAATQAADEDDDIMKYFRKHSNTAE